MAIYPRVQDQARTVDGSNTYAQLSGITTTVATVGVVGDTRTGTDGATTATSTTFTSASAVFTSADKGRSIGIVGAGASDTRSHVATITNVLSATQVTLSVAANQTTSGTAWILGTPCQAAINTLLTNISTFGGGEVLVTRGTSSHYLISGTILIPDNVTLRVDPAAKFSLLDLSRCNMVSNKDTVNGNTNCRLIGGIWDYRKDQQFWDYGAGGTDTGSPADGPGKFAISMRASSGTLSVTNVQVRDLTVKNATKYCVHIGNASDWLIENIYIPVTSSDGVHGVGPLSRGTIRNIKGTTPDDYVALGGGDYLQYQTSKGTISDILVDGLYCNGSWSSCHIWGHDNASGAVSVTNVTVKNVFGTTHDSPIKVEDNGACVGIVVDTISAVSTTGAAQVYSQAAIDVRNAVNSATSTILQVYNSSGSAIDHVSLQGVVQSAAAAHGIVAVDAGGTISNLNISDVTGTIGPGSLLSASAAITRHSFSNIYLTTSAGGVLALWNSGAAGSLGRWSNVSFSGNGFVVQSSISDVIIAMDGVEFNGTSGSGLAVTTAAAATIRLLVGAYKGVWDGLGIIWQSVSGSQISVNGPQVSCRAADLTPQAGDTIINSSATSTVPATQVTYDGTRWNGVFAGLYIPSGIAATGLYDPAKSVYNLKPYSFQKTRAALATARAGSGICRMAHIGDSTTEGVGTTTNRDLLSWPGQINGRLNTAGYTTAAAGGFKQPFTNNTGYWPDWTGTLNAEFGAGPTIILTGSQTATFTSVTAGTVLELRYLNSGASFNYVLDGGASTLVTPTGGNSVGVLTLTSLANSTHTLVITSNGSNCGIVGAAVWRSSTAGVRFWNAGIGSSTTNLWYNTGQWYYASGVVTAYGAHLLTIMLGINDVAASVSAATYAASIQGIITQAKAQGSEVLLITPNDSNTNTSVPYIQSLYGLAASNDIPLLDLNDRWGSYALANTAGLMADGNHPNLAGYGEIATAVLNILGIAA